MVSPDITQLLWCLKVPVKQTQSMKQQLISLGLFIKEFALIKEDQFVFLPIKLPANPSADWILEQRLFTKNPSKKPYQSILKEILPPQLHQLIPTSFDRVGNAILLKLEPELLPYKVQIGRVLVDYFQLKTVFNKSSEVESEFRTIDWECIAGIDDPVIIYSMHGLRWKINIRKVYFNVRLSNEYIRIANFCHSNDIIIDMFAGVGPFALLSAFHKKVTVYALDINPTAISLLKENLDLNKKYIIGSVTTLCGDSKELIKELPQANVIIMNLPGYASNFLDQAMLHILPKGTIFLHQFIHLSKEEKKISQPLDSTELRHKLATLTEKLHLKDYSWYISGNKLRDVSPSKTHVVWDITRLT